jgi:tetratricopeptide (TPR) repeat protein
MAEDASARAAELLIDEAWRNHEEDRYQAAVAAASRAVEAARLLDDPVLLVRALWVEASALQMTGDYQAALAGFTRILGLAEDPATSGRLDDPQAARAVASAHWNWVESARFVTGIPVRELFRVLDAAERWLAAAGHRDWRAAVLCQRAETHQWLGEDDAAVAAAEEALAVAVQHPDAPGYSLGTYRLSLGDNLRDAGRAAEAVPQYQAVLADPGTSPWNRSTAHEGLAWCALAADEPETARREADLAVLLSEPLGDNALCASFGVLAAACLAGKDLEAAQQAAVRLLEAARRSGGHYLKYHAARTAVDVALDRGDLTAAERLLLEMEEHAAALDASAGDTTMTDEAAQLRRRLGDMARPPDS